MKIAVIGTGIAGNVAARVSSMTSTPARSAVRIRTSGKAIIHKELPDRLDFLKRLMLGNLTQGARAVNT